MQEQVKGLEIPLKIRESFPNPRFSCLPGNYNQGLNALELWKLQLACLVLRVTGSKRSFTVRTDIYLRSQSTGLLCPVIPCVLHGF